MSELNFDNFFSEFDTPSYEDWKEACIKALKGAPFEKKMFTKTYEDITLEPIYNFEDIKDLPHIKNQFPGESPFVRGTKASGYKNSGWLINQVVPYALPETFNKTVLNDLWRGQNSLTIKVNESAWTGAIGEKSNLFLDTLEDFLVAFKGIKETFIPIYYDAGPAGLALAVQLKAFCKKVNVDFSQLKGGIDFDPIGYLTKTGKLEGNISNYYDQMAELTKWFAEETPDQTTIAVNGNNFHNSGGNAIQELAFSFASAVNYINEIGDRGLEIDTIAPRIKFNFSVGTNFFMEIAKFRAARIIWAKIIKEYGGNETSQKAFIHAETSERERTKFDPYVNMLRNTSQTFSAVVGGVDSINVSLFDAEHGLSSDFARRMSINTQHIFNEEAHVFDALDPAGGSWYIEKLTHQIAEKTWELFQDTQSTNYLELLKNGEIQKHIEDSFVQRLKNLSTRKDVILGTNKYPLLDEKQVINLYNISDSQMEQHQKDVDKFKSGRGSIEDSLLNIRNSKLNIQDLQDVAANSATTYEIYNYIIDKSSTETVTPLFKRRSAEIFETLRDNSNYYKEKNGAYPKIRLVCFGPLKVYKPRADFAEDFFKVGGFESEIIDGFSTPEDAFAKVENIENLESIVICSSDEMYEDVVWDFTKNIKEELNSDIKVILAGYPADKIDEYKDAGVDEFIHIRANIYEINKNLQKDLNIFKTMDQEK